MLCAHIFIPLGHDFSENIFENGKMLHKFDLQQLLETRPVWNLEFSDEETIQPDFSLPKIPVTCKIVAIYF